MSMHLPTGKVFLALSPPSGLIPVWHAFLKGKEKPPLRFTPWYKLHLTLFFWAQADRDKMLRIHEAIKNIVPPLPGGFTSQIEGFHFFLRPQVLYFKEISVQVQNYYKNLSAHMAELPKDIRPEIRNEFIPHWTLARKFTPQVLEKNAAFFKQLGAFRHSSVPGSVSLYYSIDGIYEPHPFFPSMRQ